MPRPLLFAALVAASLLPSAVAWGDPGTQRARELFKQGESHYGLSHFADALVSYEKAYEAKPLPGFLFNIGQCHRQLGHWETAARTYRRDRKSVV